MDDDLFKEDDDDIHKNGVVNKNYHKINQKAFKFSIDFDSSIGYYSTRLSIDVIYLPTNSYTMVYEMYVDNGIIVYQIESSSGTLSVNKTNSKIDGINTRSIIQFTKSVIHPGFDDLDIDIQLKGKNDPQTTIYVIVYGVIGIHSDVSLQVWDRLYYFDKDDGQINFETSIDMKSKKIVNLANGTTNSDAVNKSQLDALAKLVNNALGSAPNLNYYYFTCNLKHNNSNSVKFPTIDSYPFTSNNGQFEIQLSGYYHIIYTDFYKNTGKFRIRDGTNSGVLFTTGLNPQTKWTPLTINAIIKIEIKADFGQTEITLGLETTNTTVLDGAGYSTFYIKYLHA